MYATTGGDAYRTFEFMKYGLIAGNGRFPFLVLEGARAEGVELSVAAISEEADKNLSSFTSTIEFVSVGQLGKLIKFFKRENVTHVMMAGQVKHVQIFKLNAIPDLRMAKMLARLKRRNTDALLGAVADELASEGITLIDSTTFLQPLLARTGTLTKRAPDKNEAADIEYGLHVANELARLDLGQTIVVKNLAVVALEAMEGTDATIRRAAELVRGRPLTVIKVAKPNQDMRFDVPVIGLNTIATMKESNVTAVSITADKTLIFDREQVLVEANKIKLSIVANL